MWAGREELEHRALKYAEVKETRSDQGLSLSRRWLA